MCLGFSLSQQGQIVWTQHPSEIRKELKNSKTPKELNSKSIPCLTGAFPLVLSTVRRYGETQSLLKTVWPDTALSQAVSEPQGRSWYPDSPQCVIRKVRAQQQKHKTTKNLEHVASLDKIGQQSDNRFTEKDIKIAPKICSKNYSKL